MAKRKRHTELYDYMRVLMIAELSMSVDFKWGPRRKDLLKKLLKKGWIEREIVLVSRLWSGVGKTNTMYRTTKKGRKAIYRLDRNADPEMRSHQFTHPRWGARTQSQMMWSRHIELKELDKMSKNSKHLHPKKRKKIGTH